MKKGFTLIELLAVIVILAIIALIATPIVLNIIEEAKENANLRSAEIYADAVELAITKSMLNGIKVSNGTYEIMNDGSICIGIYNKDEKSCSIPPIKVDISNGPEEGTITIENNLVIEYTLTIDKQTVSNIKSTDASCFEYIDNYDYTINEDRCMTVFSDIVDTEDEEGIVEAICSGDQTYGDLIILANYVEYDAKRLEDEGIIEINEGSENGNGTVSITGDKCGGDSGTEKDVVITSKINNKTVTKIGVGSFVPFTLTGEELSEKLIDSVVISNSVETIEQSAFYENNLTSVKIGNSVTTIGRSAFESNKLTNVTIGNSVESIGNHAFYENNLTSVTIPDSVTTIGKYAFAYNNLTTVTIGTRITSIGDYAFRGGTITNSDTGIIYGPNVIENVYINKTQTDDIVNNSNEYGLLEMFG